MKTTKLIKRMALGVVVTSLIAMGSLVGTNARAAVSADCKYEAERSVKSGMHEAIFEGYVTCKGTAVKAYSVTVTLQRLVDGSWISLQSTTVTRSKGASSITAKDKGSCAAGVNSYRTLMAVTDTDGGQSLKHSLATSISCD